ncbi:MAG: hypothetical protein AAF500_01705 [Myxococcota bacterium]
MAPIAVLVLGTPIFGLSLSLDPVADFGYSHLDGSTNVLELEVPAELDRPGPTTAELLRRRNKIKRVHKALGIATWSATTLTVISGIFQFQDKFGWWASQGDAPCEPSCGDVPALHLALGALTGALFFATFGLSFAMPDPLNASEGDGDFARKLRTHKALRWVTFGGILAQIGLGLVISNPQWFGMSRAENYNALRALATTHFAIGGVTWGALTWQGAIMVF